MVLAKDLIKAITKLKNSKKAKATAPYLGMKPGLYGDGDKLLGVQMPNIRNSIKDFQSSMSMKEVDILFKSEFHEIRMAGLLILLYQYKKCKTSKEKKVFYNYYIKKVQENRINNWDYVDTSAPNLSGNFMFETAEDKGRGIFLALAESQNLWLRRVAVISTFYHIRQNEFEITLELGKMLLNDQHHLIQKAVGWMLREIGKRDEKVLLEFLDAHHKAMPRIMLSYSIEKLSKTLKKHYLEK